MVSKGARVPRLVEGVDLTKLPLTPLEGFVVSRIDGQSSLSLLGDLTSLDEDQVTVVVARLMELGVVEWAHESVSLPRATGRTATRTPTAVVVPESIRRVPSARVNVPRPIRSAAPSTEPPPMRSAHRAQQNVEERVDLSRRSAFPSQMRVSHTGPLKPAGELEEVEPGPDGPDRLERASERPPAIQPPPTGAPATVPERALPFPEPVAAEPAQASAAQASAAQASEAQASEAQASELAAAEPSPAEPSIGEPAGGSVEGSAHGGAAVEEIDLEEDRRKRIDELYIALDRLDHYQVLGLDRAAQREEVRTAYFQLSKVFHPDTMFRKRLGPYKSKMEAIFRRLTEAYEVLGKKRARDDYDRHLAGQEPARAVEVVLGGAAEERPSESPPGSSVPPRSTPSGRRRSPLPPQGADAVEPVPPAPAAPSEPAPDARRASASQPAERKMSEHARARARELMARKLQGALQASPPAPDATSVPPADGSAQPPRERVLRDLTSSLVATAGHTGGVLGAQRYVLNAKRAEEAGDLAEAARALRLALAMEPDRPELQQEHARVSAELAATLAASYEERALDDERHGKWAEAAESWAKVLEGRPDDARAARSAANALLSAKGDLHRAKDLAQKAVELQPDDTQALRILAQVYIAARLPLNARRVLQRASSLDPGDAMVENMLRELGR
jgi:curved DNA-binding protein CbpA